MVGNVELPAGGDRKLATDRGQFQPAASCCRPLDTVVPEPLRRESMHFVPQFKLGGPDCKSERSNLGATTTIPDRVEKRPKRSPRSEATIVTDDEVYRCREGTANTALEGPTGRRANRWGYECARPDTCHCDGARSGRQDFLGKNFRLTACRIQWAADERNRPYPTCKAGCWTYRRVDGTLLTNLDTL